MADNTSTQTLELSEAQVAEISQEISVLAVGLGIPFTENFYYTPELGQELQERYDALKVESQRMLEEGVANGTIVQPLPPLQYRAEDIMQNVIASNLEAHGMDISAMDKNIVRNAIDGASANIMALNALSTQQQQAPVQQTQEQSVQMVPAQDVPADVRERMMRVEGVLSQLVPTLNELDTKETLIGSIDLSAKGTIPMPGNADGYLDAQSFASYQGAMEHLNFLSQISMTNTAPSKDQPKEFLPENAAKIQELMTNSLTDAIAAKGEELKALQDSGAPAAQLSAVTSEIVQLNTLKTQTLPQVLEDLAYLKSNGHLDSAIEMKQVVAQAPEAGQPGVTSAPQGGNTGTGVSAASTGVSAASTGAPAADVNAILAQNNNDSLTDDIKDVERVLYGLGETIQGFDKFGLSQSVVTPLTKEQSEDGNFDAASQDLFTKAIVLVKTLNGDKNPDGVYNAQVGEQLKLAILSHDALGTMRNQLGIQQMDVADAKRYLAGPPMGASAEQVAAHKEFQDRVTEQYKLQGVNGFIDSLNRLHEADVLDPQKKAQSSTKMNLMLDAASNAMDKWAPGFKAFLQDFFTNSDFGQMIGGLLSMFGINVGRLWGDTDDAAATERARPVVEKGFQKYYDAAANELGPNATFAQVMGKTREEMMSDLEGSWAFDKAMDILFKDQEDEVVKNALNAALDNAEKAGSPEAAKAAFAQTLIDAGQQFQNGQELDIEQLNIYLDQAVEGVQNAVEERPELGAPASVSDADLTAGSNISTAGQGKTLDANGEAYVRDETRAAVDAELIEAGEQRIELVFTPNKDEWIQGPTRYAHGRVDDIQEVLGNNAELLALSLSPDMMKIDGQYTDMMTPNTNAVIEETLIRAQLHAISEQGVEITQEILDGLDRKLSLTNLEVVTDYMRAQGVADADIDRFSANVTELGNDFFSTDPNDKLAGDKQEHTVWNQSHFGNQFKLDIAQWAPEAKAAPLENVPDEVDPLYQKYLDYNKDRPCDIPMFFIEDGKAYAAIVDQNGTKADTTDDQFKVIELNSYLKTEPHNLYDPADQRALLDNYNWSNPTKEGVEAVINKVLCLESFSLVVDAPKVAQSQPQHEKLEHSPFNLEEPALHTKRPEVYKDLPKFDNTEWADFVAKGIGIADHQGLVKQANRDLTHVLDAFWETQTTAPRGGQSNFQILALDDFGLEHPEFDAIIAMRDGKDTDYRYVNYEKHDIVPISEQRQRGFADIKDKSFDPTADRRLDDFLDEITHERQGPNKGYLHAESIVPGSNVPRAVNSFSAVYQMSAGSSQNNRPLYSHYTDAYMERFFKRSQYEGAQDHARKLRSTAEVSEGMSVADRRALDQQAGHLLAQADRRVSQANGTPRNEFNNQSGCDEYINSNQRFKDSDLYKGTRKIPLIGDVIGGVGDIITGGVDTVTRTGKAIGGGGLDALDNSYTPAEMRAAEECRMRNQQSSATDIYQNMSDMGLDSDLNPAAFDGVGSPTMRASSEIGRTA